MFQNPRILLTIFRMSSLQTRYQSLYYPGSGSDATPLPIAESALYVDAMPSNYPKSFPNGKHGNEPAEKFILNKLLKMVKKLFLLQKEPLVDWSTHSMNRTTAVVLFTWNDMPGLTQNGQSTKLTYLFNTYDYELVQENMSHLLLGVDIFWSADGWNEKTYRHIDLTKTVIASRVSLECLPISEDKAKNSKFYHTEPLKSYIGRDWRVGTYDFTKSSGYPEYLPILLSRMLQQGTMSFEDWQNYARTWLSTYNHQKQDSSIRTGDTGEAICIPDLCQNYPTRFSDVHIALQEVSKREKELILVLAATENDLNTLKELESMGTNIEARTGI